MKQITDPRANRTGLPQTGLPQQPEAPAQMYDPSQLKSFLGPHPYMQLLQAPPLLPSSLVGFFAPQYVHLLLPQGLCTSVLNTQKTLPSNTHMAHSLMPSSMSEPASP